MRISTNCMVDMITDSSKGTNNTFPHFTVIVSMVVHLWIVLNPIEFHPIK